MKKSIVNMTDWELHIYDNGYYLSGIADNHPRLGKNSYVSYTSDLVDFNLEADILTYETENTIYCCPLKYMTICPYSNVDYEYKMELVNRINETSNDLDRIIAATAKLSLEYNRDNGGSSLTPENKTNLVNLDFSDDVWLSHIKELQIIGQTEIVEKESQENERLMNLAKQYEDCIYMEISNVDRGDKLAYNLKNSIGVVRPIVHSGMFHDSILYMEKVTDDKKKGRLDFRYFPEGLGDVMKTYSWSDNILRVVIKNVCQHTIVFNGKTVGVGETKVFESNSQK